MESLFVGSLGFSGFVLLFALIIGAWVLYILVLRRYLKLMIAERGAEGFDFGFIAIERIFALFSALLVFGLYIRLNPILHTILVLVLIAFLFSQIIEVVKGIQAILELKLEEGQEIHIDGQVGGIHRLGWTGIFLTSNKSVSFVTYSKFLDNKLEYKNKSIPLISHLLCKHDDTLSSTKQIASIQNQLFLFPLISSHQKPTVEFTYDGIVVSLSTKDSSYLEGFIAQLTDIGFDVTIIDQY